MRHARDARLGGLQDAVLRSSAPRASGAGSCRRTSSTIATSTARSSMEVLQNLTRARRWDNPFVREKTTDLEHKDNSVCCTSVDSFSRAHAGAQRVPFRARCPCHICSGIWVHAARRRRGPPFVCTRKARWALLTVARLAVVRSAGRCSNSSQTPTSCGSPCRRPTCTLRM